MKNPANTEDARSGKLYDDSGSRLQGLQDTNGNRVITKFEENPVAPQAYRVFSFIGSSLKLWLSPQYISPTETETSDHDS
jgi:hypothetical protein